MTDKEIMDTLNKLKSYFGDNLDDIVISMK